jgi:glycosyltransferase involved in cell wall biosynthesis
LQKINVLHLRDSNGIYGAERVVLTLGRNIDTSKYNFILLCMRRSDGRSEELINAARKFNIKVLTVDIDSRLSIAGILKIRYLLKSHDIKIIHTHDFKSDFYALFASLFLGIRRIATVHGSTRDSLKIRLYLYLSERIIYRYYHKVLAVSQQLVGWLTKCGVDQSKIVVIQNGIDPSLIKEMSGENVKLDLALPPQSHIFAIIGRLFPDKGHLYFVEAFKEVLKVHKNIRAVVVGEGPYDKEIMNRIQELGLQKEILVLGFQQNMRAVYNIIDTIVIPSLREGLPYVLLESMVFKIPVLATAVGDVPLLIKNEQTGVLIPPGDGKALEKAMLAMLDRPDHYRQLAENGYQQVMERFSHKRMLQKTEVMYQELI